MKQFVIIGLDYFGKNVLDELMELGADILVIDKDRDVIDAYRDSEVNAISLDILNEESLRRVMPKDVDAVVIDLGKKIEASILATSYCRKMGIEKIIVKAETEGHAEILELVGASKIVFPNREAAKRITPLMVSSSLLNYLPVSGKLVIAELEVPPRFFGVTLMEAALRQKYGINLISIKNGTIEEYGLVTPDYQFRQGDVALVSGPEEALTSFAGVATRDRQRGKGFSLSKLGKIFGNGKNK